jgi:5-aminopentanamidase
MRIASFQRFPIFDDVERAARNLLRDLQWAEHRNVDLALFPECYLQGHSYERSIIERRAIAVDDNVFLKCLQHFRPIETAAIIGFFERRADNIYNSAMLTAGGELLGIYAKANPLEDGCVAGKEFPVWRRGGQTFGINICSDFRKPLLTDRLAEKGAAVICAPLNMMLQVHKIDRWREPAIESLRSCAIRTGCWVVSSDVVGDNGNGWMSCGCTLAVRPDGTIAEKVPEWEEGVILVDIV